MSFGLAQAVNDPTAQANIHASDVTSKFASEINPSSHYINHNVNRNYYSIGSSPNSTVPENSKTDTVQPTTNGNTSIVNTYYTTYNIYNGTDILQSNLNQSKQNSSSTPKAETKRNSNSAVPTENIREKLGITANGSPISSTETAAEKSQKTSITSGAGIKEEDTIGETRGSMKDFPNE